ncbi:MAG: PepSY domain-containing protein, partial [Moraxella sp.]|nr:PepSY domain-containing protein [Moraxella sp.]
ASTNLFGKPSAKAVALEQSAITAVQAIINATKSGGYATEVDFKHKNSQSYYKVEVQTATGTQKVFVDATNGQIINTRADNNRDNDDDNDVVIANPRISMQQAITIAQASTNGSSKAKDAELKSRNGQVYYSIELLNNGQKQKVRVDATSGQIMQGIL